MDSFVMIDFAKLLDMVLVVRKPSVNLSSIGVVAGCSWKAIIKA